MDAYVEVFVAEDWDFEATAAAFCAHRARSQFWPAISELKDQLVAAAVQAPDVDQAWAEVYRAVGPSDPTGCPEFSHPAITDTIRGLGWDTLWYCPPAEIRSFRAQFRVAYGERIQRERDNVRFAGLRPPRRLAALPGRPPLRLLEDRHAN